MGQVIFCGYPTPFYHNKIAPPMEKGQCIKGSFEPVYFANTSFCVTTSSFTNN